jgi:hypothetical protein
MDDKEFELRKRELDLEEQRVEIERSKAEHVTGGPAPTWSSPLVVAIFAGVLTLLGNAVVSIVQSQNAVRLETAKAELNRELELVKTEQTRILEMIKTGGDAEQARKNLNFLLETGLIADEVTANRLKDYFDRTEPADFPTLSTGGDFARQSSGKADVPWGLPEHSSVECAKFSASITFDRRWYSAKVSEDEGSCTLTFGFAEELAASELGRETYPETREFHECEYMPVRFVTNIKEGVTGWYGKTDERSRCGLSITNMPRRKGG